MILHLPDGRDWLWGNLGLAPVGKAMLRKSNFLLLGGAVLSLLLGVLQVTVSPTLVAWLVPGCSRGWSYSDHGEGMALLCGPRETRRVL